MAQEGVARTLVVELVVGILARAGVEPGDEGPAVVARTEQILRIVLHMLEDLFREGGDQGAAVLVLQDAVRHAIRDLDQEDQVLLDHVQALTIALVDEALAVQIDRLVHGDAPGDEGQCARNLRERALLIVVPPMTLDT